MDWAVQWYSYRASVASGVGLQVGFPATKRLAGLQADQVQAGLKRDTPAARLRRKFCKAHFLVKNSYTPEATLTLKNKTTEELELSFSFWQWSGTDDFRVVQVSGSTEEELWSAANPKTTGYLDVGGIKVKKGVKIKFIANGSDLVYFDEIKSVATTSISSTSATIPVSTTINILSPAQIETKIKDLESIVSSGTSLTKQTFIEVVNTVGNLTLSRKHYNKKTTQRLLRILDQVANKVNVSDGEVFNATTPNVFVAVVNLPEANSTNGGDVYGVELSVVNHLTTGFSNESFSLHYEEKNTNQSNISFHMKSSTKAKVSWGSAFSVVGTFDFLLTWSLAFHLTDNKVSFYSFLGDSLFYSNTSMNAIEEDAGYEASLVNSHVVLSATLLDPEVSTENLTKKIKVSFRINENTSIFGSSFCGFWVEDESYWSSKGCTKLSSSEELLSCECNHLTNFASLFAYGNLTHDKGLDILTYVGCSTSAIASLLMIIALLIIWKSTKVQMRQSTKFVMLNLSFCLLLLNILILISEIPGVRSDGEKCKAVAGTLHFALISAFLWMFAQAVPVFISIIKPIYFRVSFSSKKFAISFLLLGWGLPLILVVLIGSLKPGWYVNQVNDVNHDKTPNIQGKFRCWIVPDMMIYLVIIPAAVLLSGNILLYVSSTAKYLLQKRPGEKPIKRREGQLKTNLKFSVTLFLMFGITWIFGFLIFNSSDVSLAFAYIFTIFNSLQDGTSDVVHKKWLHGNNKCYCPPNESDVQLLVKQKADAKPEWQLFFCGILCQSKTYEGCLRKAYSSGHVTPSQSDSDGNITETSNLDFENGQVQTQTINLNHRSALKRLAQKLGPLSNEPPHKKQNMPQFVSYSHEISLLKADISLLHLNVSGIEDKLDSLMSLSLLQKNE
ncbi:unnamed protein product [Clavelina lepadiformis]|uniref:Uncharacterized protein n=1 Tax=Clavelina lepadiformis TaxID=159417 RepID=A0ABP0G539_CLALP